jgi:hypothetical protein
VERIVKKTRRNHDEIEIDTTVDAVRTLEFVGVVAGRAAEKSKPDLGEAPIVRTWGAAVLRPNDIVRVVLMWVMLCLNPAIWETIAATGCRTWDCGKTR